MFTMKEACEQTHLPYETLKFYCNQGLVPNVKRDKNNRRIFDERDIAWINSLNCLKNCGMSIAEMKEYIELCLIGESTIPKRKVILDNKRKSLVEQLKQVQDCIDYIDWKQGFYDDVLSGKTKYYSNLINTEEQYDNQCKTTCIGYYFLCVKFKFSIAYNYIRYFRLYNSENYNMIFPRFCLLFQAITIYSTFRKTKIRLVKWESNLTNRIFSFYGQLSTL